MIETHVEGKERYQNGSREFESYKRSENMNSIRKLKSPPMPFSFVEYVVIQYTVKFPISHTLSYTVERTTNSLFTLTVAVQHYSLF